MVLFRITNALLGVLAAIWWLINRQNDMAEPVVAIIGCSIFFIEFTGEVVAAKVNSRREFHASLRTKVLADILKRIELEESNIQQVIDGKRKKDKIIEENPIELIEPHVSKLEKLSGFRGLAIRLRAQLDFNKALPAGEKQFRELQTVLREIDSSARHPRSDRQNWLWGLCLVVALCAGFCGTAFVRLPLDRDISNQSNEHPQTIFEAVESNATKGDV